MLRFLLSLLLLVSFFQASAASTNSPGWNFFGGDESHTGFAPVQIIEKPIKKAFTTSLLNDPTLSYSTTCQGFALTIGAGSGVLFIVQLSTGSIVHSVFLERGYSWSAPVCMNGLVYATDVSNNGDLNSWIIDLSTGQVLNSYRATVSQGFNFPYGPTGNTATNILFTPGGQFNGEIIASNSTGSVLFDVSFMRGASGSDSWTPTVAADGRTFVNNGQGLVSPGMFGEINPVDGSLIWSVNISSTVAYSTYWVPAISNQLAIAFSVSIRRSGLELGAISLNQRKILWVAQCPQPLGPGAIDFSPSTDGNSVFLTCVNGIFEYSAINGTLLAKFPCNNCYNKPIVTLDSLIVSSATQTLIFRRDNQALVHAINQAGSLAFDVPSRQLLITPGGGSISSYVFQ